MRTAGVLAMAGLFLAGTAEAAPDHPINLELNTMTQVDMACRLTVLADNEIGAEIGELGLEIAIFDKDGHLDRFLVMKTGRLPPGKSRVRQFDVPNLACTSVSKVLVNDVTDCTGDKLTAAVCLDALAVTSRAGIPLSL